MKQRPKLLLFTSLVLIGVVISIPLQIIFQTQVTALNIDILLSQITIFNWFVIAMCLITLSLTFNGHKLLGLAIVPLLLAIHINNYFVFKYALHTQWYLPLFASLGATALALLFIINKTVRFTVKNPDKRWWLIPKRYQKTLPIWVVLDEDLCVLAHTHDLSKTGAFISMSEDSNHFLDKELELGKEVKVLIGNKDDVEFHCKAQVVRKAQATGSYPQGIGLHFEDVSMIEKFHLGRILNNPTLGL
ncbi:putative membrane protein [Halobacteriovorax marinus SJ]|uniref:Membrane protein n=1 Tax=Halobacteriovorax marinus (strain ATCC BAA-682 / DSM 15412 / SJ) TaxID=862908 RepID=E1WZM7_HALMS|nr:PilZ domain-containing protein [Halobacteriovorax marinus]CBW26213.1 putative membrane protein [Halobacteriovorax marinus SJ]